jgi:hypothetical protein
VNARNGDGSAVTRRWGDGCAGARATYSRRGGTAPRPLVLRGGQAAAGTTNFTAVADTFVSKASPKTNYGAAAESRVVGAPNDLRSHSKPCLQSPRIAAPGRGRLLGRVAQAAPAAVCAIRARGCGSYENALALARA